MGEVRFVRQAAYGRDVVFAYAPDGRAAWGLDLGSGQQWWYADGDTPAVRDAVAANWCQFRHLPAVVAQGAATDAGDGPDPARDLLSQRAGHAVLAKIATLHAAAMAGPGLPVPVLPDEIVNWSVGFVGEEAVAAQLQRLGPEWTVLHAVPIGKNGADIDHVVIGPAGVLCLNTKHHRGVSVDVRGEAVFVAGQYQRYVAASQYEEDRTAEIVRGVRPDTPVRSVLVVVGARLRVREQPPRTVALSHDQLVSWIQQLPTQLTHEEIAHLRDRLRRPQTWTTSPAVTPAPEWVAELARSLATERAVVADQRRGVGRVARSTGSNRATRAGTPSAGSDRVRKARPRNARSVQSHVGRLVAVVAVGIAAVLVGPALVGLVLSSIAASVPTREKPATPVKIVAVAGQACSPRGATSKDAGGKSLVCVRLSAAKPTTLVWKRSG